MQRVLSELEAEDLLHFARVGRGVLRAWYVTEQGAELAEAIPDRVEDRRKLLDARQASGPLQAHTLAVNEVGLCFLRAARERGDEFAARSWRHEVAHPIGPAPGMRRGEVVICDAVFAYLLVEEDEAIRFNYRFVELDRGTLPLDKLDRKLSRYTRLYGFRPRPQRRGDAAPPAAWKAHYPVFPEVLVCFADRPRAVLERRRWVVAQLCRTNPELEQTPVRFSFCLLDDLREKGPFAPIFTESERPEEWVDWLGQSGERAPENATETTGEA